MRYIGKLSILFIATFSWSYSTHVNKVFPINTNQDTSINPKSSKYIITGKEELKIRVSPDTLLNYPDELVIKINKVINPLKMPLGLSICFKDTVLKSNWKLNNIYFYPVDRPGTFVLRVNKIIQVMAKDSELNKGNIFLSVRIITDAKDSGWEQRLSSIEIHISNLYFEKIRH
jgi:hypothetical protein